MNIATALIALGIAVDPNGPEEQRVNCPRCATRANDDDDLGANIGTGVFSCFKCKWGGRVGGDITGSARPIARIDDPTIAERKRARLRQTWRATVSLTQVKSRAVRCYLESRALGAVLRNPPTAVLRAHPGLVYWDGASDFGTFPAMVALLHGAAGQPVTLHVTYLRADGCAKASVPNPKKILGVPIRGTTKGGAIHLHEPRAGILGIAEGVESALSLHLLKTIPVWASYCAGNLEHVRLPSGLREFYIGVDVDESGKGEQVARALAKRVRNWSPRTRTYYVRPELAGPGDLNDELRRVC
jgi:phage/plasmid primase-like uncharacterized protein